ncbi:MAG: clostripain-related cysteine peptidase [Thermoplasmata archaeon]
MRKLWAFLLFSLLLISYMAMLSAPSKGQTAKWTFMVYMGADSSLEGFGIDDFNEMAVVGSTDDVNIVVQFDRRPGGTSANGDWTTAKRFFITKDMTPDPTSAVSDIDEVNMGDPQELVEFMNWGMTDYPADRYFLGLWGHGLGWRGVVQDSSSSSDYLELDELTWAFQSIVANNSGKKIDLVGADACRMTTEMNYQLKDYVSFFVGSQKDEPEPGWPYNTILFNLTNDPDMGPAELGMTIADRYVESYVDQTGLAVALSVVDSSRLDYLAEEIRRFVDQARSALPMFPEQFKDARLDSESYEGNAVYDLYDIFDKLQAEFAIDPAPLRLDSALRSSKEAVLTAVSHENNWDNPTASIRTTYARGMSIWYPLGIFNQTYHQLDFNLATGWDDYLDDYRAVINEEVPDPGVNIDIDMSFRDADDNGLDDTVQLTFQSPKDGTLEIDVFYHFRTEEYELVTMFLPAGVQRMKNITLPENIYVDLDIYLLNETRVWMNNSLYRNVLEKGYTITGFVHDRKGDPVLGASVTIENVVSGETVEVQSGASGYSGVIPPSSLSATNITDTIKVTVEYNDWSSSITFLMTYPPEEEVVNFVLGAEDQPSTDSLLTGLLILLVIVEAVFVVLLAFMLMRRRKGPLEKTGDELLRELKLE